MLMFEAFNVLNNQFTTAINTLASPRPPAW